MCRLQPRSGSRQSNRDEQATICNDWVRCAKQRITNDKSKDNERITRREGHLLHTCQTQVHRAERSADAPFYTAGYVTHPAACARPRHSVGARRLLSPSPPLVLGRWSLHLGADVTHRYIETTDRHTNISHRQSALSAQYSGKSDTLIEYIHACIIRTDKQT